MIDNKRRSRTKRIKDIEHQFYASFDVEIGFQAMIPPFESERRSEEDARSGGRFGERATGVKGATRGCWNGIRRSGTQYGTREEESLQRLP